VKTTGRYVEDIAALHCMPSKERCDVTFGCEGVRNVCSSYAWVASEQNLSARCRFENNPRFMFANRVWAVRCTCQLIVGVHLNGEALLHIKQFHQHAARLLVGITEPCFANWAARHIRSGQRTKPVAAPHARN
jgi:hypothetical protein